MFLRQFDVAADGPAASLTGAAVGRRHQPGTATRHDREPKPRKAATDLAPERIVRMRLVEACRAEHCHAGADEVEGAETENELPGDAEHQAQFLQAGMGSFEEDFLPVCCPFLERGRLRRSVSALHRFHRRLHRYQGGSVLKRKWRR